MTYLSGVERGIRNPSLKNIRAIANALEVPVGDLFSFDSWTVWRSSPECSDARE